MKSNLSILLKRKLYIEHIFPDKTRGHEREMHKIVWKQNYLQISVGRSMLGIRYKEVNMNRGTVHVI